MKYLCILGCLLAASVASGQVLVVGTKAPNGEISFQEVEEFQINAHTQVRFLPEPKSPVDANAINRLKKFDLVKEVAQIGGVIRNDGEGRLVHWKGPERATELLVPENYTIKGTAKPADVPGALQLTLVHSKKTKQAEPLDTKQFFVYLGGASKDRAVLEFVSKDWAFVNTQEQFAAVQGFVTSFKGSPAVTEYRNTLRDKLSDGLAAFEDGGPYKDLTLLRQFSELGHKAFADDAEMVGLDDKIVGRISFVEKRKALLRSLAVAGDWDTLLAQYQDFEHYQWSFPDVMALRQEALEESARAHSIRARAYGQRGDLDGFENAAKEATVGQQRDPLNPEIADLVKAEKLEASKRAAPRAVATRKILLSDSPDGLRFNQAVFNAERAIQDKKFPVAEQALQEAERVDKDSPKVVLTRAKLFAASGRLADALHELDQYGRMVVDKAERDEGDKVRFDVEYNIASRKEASKQQITSLLKDGEYSNLDQLLKDALRMDGEDSDFLYNGGLVAGVLKQPERGRDLLTKYLDRSDALNVDPKVSDKAWRVRNALTISARPKAQGTPNWMSRRPLAAGVYYCPESLAFQLPIDSVTWDKVHIAFHWDKDHLESILTTFDDEKAQQQFRQWVSQGNPGTQAGVAPPDKVGKFYFRYLSPTGPLLGVRNEAPAPGETAPPFQVKLVNEKTSSHLVDTGGAPVLALWGSPYVDTEVLGFLGSRVATTVAGNSVFDPFIWDGLHYFTLKYDEVGRVSTAQEWNVDNVLRFTWDSDRLKEIRGFRENGSTQYYRRLITYSGVQIQAEEFTLNGKSGHIRYVYGDNKTTLQKIEIEQDGKTWTAKLRP
jgi:tetratricopeptide (TPR) repeat protein